PFPDVTPVLVLAVRPHTMLVWPDVFACHRMRDGVVQVRPLLGALRRLVVPFAPGTARILVRISVGGIRLLGSRKAVETQVGPIRAEDQDVVVVGREVDRVVPRRRRSLP